MKTVLASLNSKFVHSNLAIRYLKAYCNFDNIEIFEATINENIYDSAIKIMDLEPEIAAFSCYIWNIEETLKLCSILKEINKKIIIILGGPEVSYDSIKTLENYEYIDFIVNGEGEVPFQNLLKAIYSNENNFDDIKGIAFRKNGEPLKTENEPLIENLDSIPFPYNYDLPDKIVYYEAARGCPFNCSYCLSSTIKGVRYFSLERVKKDLQFFIDRDVKLVKFVDRTFNANKSFAVEIWKYLIENCKNTKFHFEIAVDIMDESMIEVLKKAPEGLFQFEIGVQTTNIDILKNINRIMDFEKVKRNIELIRNNCKIHCHLDLIAGLPGENIESFKKSFNMCMDLNPDVLQLGFLKVLKGSPVSKQTEEYGIKHIGYPPYQVLYTNDLSFKEMKKLLEFEKIFDTFYNNGIFKNTMNYLLLKIDDKFKFFKDLCDFSKNEGLFDRNLNLADKFKLFYGYGALYDEKYVIRDLLLYDYIINTKKAYIPLFFDKSLKGELKQKINEERNTIMEKFHIKDLKSIFPVPMDIKLNTYNGDIKIEKQSCTVVFNLNDGKYMYI